MSVRIILWIATVTFSAIIAATFSASGHARPVRIGRFVEIPFGIRREHPYSTDGANPERTGRVSARAPAQRPERVWEQIRVPRPTTPAVSDDGTLYISSATGVTALTKTGQVAWDLPLGFVAGTPSITPEGHLAIGTHGGALLVLSRRGEEVFRETVGGAVRGSPLVLPDGSLVLGGFDQAVHRFDADGRRLFRTPLPEQVASGSPTWTTTGRIVIASGTSILFLSASGQIVAQSSLSATVVGSPAVAPDGTLWVLTQDATLHSLDAEGRFRTRTAIGGRVSGGGAIAVASDGSVRVGTRDDAIVCVGPSGTERWRLTGEGSFVGGLTLDLDDTLLAISQAGRLVAVDARGQVMWRIETGSFAPLTSPVLGADGTIYLVTLGGSIQAWRHTASP